jgi:CheY-like chemotaxis protein
MKKLLIIDDERAFRELIAARFPAPDFQVFEAATGTEGLERIDSDGPFDAICLDIMMKPGPRLTACLRGFDCGLFVLRTLKATHAEVLKKILVVTVRDDGQLEEALKELDIAEWCSKNTDDVEQISIKLKRIAGAYKL